MTFNTENNKLEKLWNEVENNQNIIITQKDINNFIIDGINELNRTNTTFPILTNFSSDWLIPTILENPNSTIDGNIQEFRLTFKNIDPLFIPYIHCEIIYRVGTSGVIPVVNNSNPPPDEIAFDEDIGSSNKLQTSEIFQISDNDVEYITFMRMDFDSNEDQEVEYKFICYILNPHYYQAT